MRFEGKYKFLSNFYSVPISFEGIMYPSVEHAYQAAKTLNEQERLRIMRLGTAAQAKRAGRYLKGLRPNWDGIKLNIMLELLRKKFFFKNMQRMLIATGDEELKEENHWHDTFWGVCEGVGENHLGKLLMQVREEVKCALAGTAPSAAPYSEFTS